MFDSDALGSTSFFMNGGLIDALCAMRRDETRDAKVGCLHVFFNDCAGIFEICGGISLHTDESCAYSSRRHPLVI